MARVRLTADVDPELRRRVQIAAASSDTSVSEWIEDVVQRELEGERRVIFIGDAKVSMPPPGMKPQGSKNPPRLKDGSSIAEAVIEDRR